MNKIDSIDEQLIKLLQEDATQTSRVLAKKLNLSPVTVRRRIKKLIRNKVMRIGAIVDPRKIGIPLSVVISLDVAPDKLPSVLKELAKRPEITWVSSTTGRFDIVALARFSSTDGLSKFIQSEISMIDGVKDSEVSVCLQLERRAGHYSEI